MGGRRLINGGRVKLSAEADRLRMTPPCCTRNRVQHPRWRRTSRNVLRTILTSNQRDQFSM
jgi:hypothetical protein